MAQGVNCFPQPPLADEKRHVEGLQLRGLALTNKIMTMPTP
jgi:hypothetical protein